MNRFLSAGLLASMAITATARSGDTGVVVTQRDRAFSTPELTVARGTVLHFTNEDEFPHQINANGPEVDLSSGLQGTGEVVDLLLPAAGVTEVRCGIHPRMRLTVRVQ